MRKRRNFLGAFVSPNTMPRCRCTTTSRPVTGPSKRIQCTLPSVASGRMVFFHKPPSRSRGIVKISRPPFKRTALRKCIRRRAFPMDAPLGKSSVSGMLGEGLLELV